MNHEAEYLKQCCAQAYASPWLTLVLGESWHPGGLKLTEHLGRLLALSPTDLLADVATGRGASARHLAQTMGCKVTGVDFGAAQVQQAERLARSANLQGQVHFQQADAEGLPWGDHTIDALICECALCTFPSPQRAVQEWARVLKPGGRLGLTDVTRCGDLISELDNITGWVGCLAGAQPLATYRAWLVAAGFEVTIEENRSEDLLALVERVGRAVTSWLHFRGHQAEGSLWSASAVDRLLRQVVKAIESGQIGYGLLVAHRPQES